MHSILRVMGASSNFCEVNARDFSHELDEGGLPLMVSSPQV